MHHFSDSWQDSHPAIASLPRLISIAGILKFIAGHVKPEYDPPSCSIGPLLPESGVMTYFLMLRLSTSLLLFIHQSPFSSSEAHMTNHISHLKQLATNHLAACCCGQSGTDFRRANRPLKATFCSTQTAVHARWAVCCHDLGRSQRRNNKGPQRTSRGNRIFLVVKT